MDRETIIRMAKEAGFERLVAVESNFVNPRISELFNSDGTGSLTKFAQLVAAHEREACKALCVCGYVSCDRP